MARIKGKLKAPVLILVGFVAGAILAGGFIAWRYFQLFKDQYYTGIFSNINTATMIRSGREEELLKNIESNTQQCVGVAESQWGNDESRLYAFWSVQRYYEKFNLPVPIDIKLILDKLPPRPLTSCERRRISEASETQKSEPTPAEISDKPDR